MNTPPIPAYLEGRESANGHLQVSVEDDTIIVRLAEGATSGANTACPQCGVSRRTSLSVCAAA